MAKFSTNGFSITTLIAALAYTLFNVDIDVAQLDMVVAGIMALISIVGLIRNQWKRPDIAKFFIRK